MYNKIPPPFRHCSHPKKIGWEEKLHQVLFLISLVYECFLVLGEQENRTYFNRINI